MHGEGSNCSGREGADVTVRVPVGTQIFDAATNSLLHDFVEHGARWLVARGGRGGFGNAHFATSTNRAPRYHQEGSPGEEFELQLELKLLADIGLVGFPNAGKSTFISTISAAIAVCVAPALSGTAVAGSPVFTTTPSTSRRMPLRETFRTRAVMRTSGASMSVTETC